jgi:hypothetical protein
MKRLCKVLASISLIILAILMLLLVGAAAHSCNAVQGFRGEIFNCGKYTGIALALVVITIALIVGIIFDKKWAFVANAIASGAILVKFGRMLFNFSTFWAVILIVAVANLACSLWLLKHTMRKKR